MSKSRPFIYLLIFSGIITGLLLLIRLFSPAIVSSHIIIQLVAGFTLIAFSVLLIFYPSTGKDPEKSVFSTLIALGLKMLLSFVFALVFFLGFKNRELASVILFFVLYLLFTSFVILIFVTTLKKRELK